MRFIERNNILYFTLKVQRKNARQWLDNKDFYFGRAEPLLCTHWFRKTEEKKQVEIAVVRANAIKSLNPQFVDMREVKNHFEFKTPAMDIACMLRAQLNESDMRGMDLSQIRVMHTPVMLPAMYSDRYAPHVLGISNIETPWIQPLECYKDFAYAEGYGFAFISK